MKIYSKTPKGLVCHTSTAPTEVLHDPATAADLKISGRPLSEFPKKIQAKLERGLSVTREELEAAEREEKAK